MSGGLGVVGESTRREVYDFDGSNAVPAAFADVHVPEVADPVL